MKTYEEWKQDFDSGKEFTHADVEEMLKSFKRYYETMGSFIEQFERIFLITGEACGYDIESLCQKCSTKKP